MTVVDTNVWVDHLRAPDPVLASLLREKRALMRPYVLGELVLGAFAARSTVLARLAVLPPAPVAPHGDVMRLIEAEALYGIGIGYIDAHLLASARATLQARL